MPTLSRFAILPLSLTLALAARQEPTYDLIWRPKANDAMTYKLRMEIESTPEKFTFLANLKNRVLKVKPNGDYDVETATKDAHVQHGTHDDPITDDNKATVDTYNQRGLKIASSEDSNSSDEANPGLNTLDAITDQIAPADPVSVGKTWSTIVKANPKQKREAARVNYTLAGKIKQGVYQSLKIEFKYHETEKDSPVTAEGYVLLNADDFSLVRLEASLKGAKFSADPDFPNGDATVSLIRD